MILKNLRRVKVSNLLSFNDKSQEIFFTAENKYSSSKFDYIESETRKQDKILPVTLLYGANASGKTNFIDVFGRIGSLLKRVGLKDNEKNLPYMPFDGSKAPVCMEVEFVLNDQIYLYIVEYDSSEIHKEVFCSLNSNNSLRKLYERNDKKISFHSMSGISAGVKKEIRERLSTRRDVSVLEILKIRNIEQYAEGYDFLTSLNNDLGIARLKLLFDDVALRKEVVKCLKYADVGITDMHIEKYDDGFRKKMLSAFSKMDMEGIELSEDVFYFASFSHRGINKKIKAGLESSGTKKFIDILTYILPMFFKTGGVYISDEIERSLHPLLVKKIIEMFHDKRINKCGAQLIATTHEISLLAPDVLSRDEIWFVEKDYQCGNSIVYPLSSFKDIRSSFDYRSGYLDGLFGGIPYLGSVDNLIKQLKG